MIRKPVKKDARLRHCGPAMARRANLNFISRTRQSTTQEQSVVTDPTELRRILPGEDDPFQGFHPVIRSQLSSNTSRQLQPICPVLLLELHCSIVEDKFIENTSSESFAHVRRGRV